MRKEVQLGILLLIILSTGVVMLRWHDAGLQIRIDQDKSTFYMLQDGHYQVKAREYNNLWDFPSKLNRDLSSVKISSLYDNLTNKSLITRTTFYQRGPEIYDAWSFDGNVKDVTQFPLDHSVTIKNAKGYVYEYVVRDLRDYQGPTEEALSPLKIGKLTIIWNPGAYFSKVYKTGILKARYTLTSNDETFHFRVYDPPATVNLYFDDGSTNHTAPVDVEYGSTVKVWGVESTGTNPVCLSADNQPGIGHNVSCGTGSTSYDWTIGAGTNEFNDSTTATNLTFTGAQNKTAYVSDIRSGSEIDAWTIGLTGFQSSGSYPKNPEIEFDSNGDTQALTGDLEGGLLRNYYFSDGSTSWTGSYTSTGSKTVNLLLPKNYNVSNASFNLTGSYNDNFKIQEITTVTDSDGAYYRPYAPNCDYDSSEDEVYCFGGSCGDTFCQTNGGTYNTSVRIDRGGGIGSVHAEVPVPYKAGIGSCAVYYNGYFYVIGGYDSSSFYSTVYRYNPSFNSWTAMTSIPEPKAYFQCALHPDTNQIIISGGYTTGSSWDISAYRYNITADTWTAIADPPAGQEQGWGEYWNSTAVIMYGGTRMGGASGGRTYRYNLNTNSWDTLATIYHYPYGNTGANIDGTIYSYGGYFNPDGYEKWVYRYDVSTNSWIRLDTISAYNFFMDDCMEVNNHTECMGSGGFGIGSDYRTIYHLPEEVGVQVGNTLGTAYQGTGTLTSTTVNTGDFSSQINNELSKCTANSQGLCNVTLYVGNIGAGNVTLDNVNITTPTDKIAFSASNVTCGTTYCNPSIRVQSDQQGVVQLNNLNLTYAGTGAVTWNASSPGDGGTITAGSTTGTTTVYYSKMNRSLPYTWTRKIFFLPNSYNMTLCPAWGQDDTTPIVNVTGDAQDKSFDLYLKLNQSISCLSWYYNTASSSGSASSFTNTSYTDIGTFTTNGNNEYWLWATLNECNASVQRYLQPELSWTSCCTTCIACP